MGLFIRQGRRGNFNMTFSEDDHRQVELGAVSGRYYTDQWMYVMLRTDQILAPFIEKNRGQFNGLIFVDHASWLLHS